MLQYDREHSQRQVDEQTERSPHVLVIDDNANLLSILAEILDSNGFIPRTAANPSEAIEALTASAPDVIVCDVMMPEMNGFELHDYICKNPSWVNIPFVFLSALSDTKDVRLAKQQGCDDYLLKPFDPSDLVAVLRGKIALAKHRQAIQEARLDAYRRRIIHTLSHEFRTPLVAINTGTELLLEQGAGLGQDRVKHLLESIQRGGQRLHRMVDDFMTLQQIDSGLALTSCRRLARSTSALRVVEHAIERFNETIVGEYVQIDFCAEGVHEDLKIDVYDVHIIDVLQRLFSNAQKFGGHESRIVVTLSVHDGEAVISVRDFGPGMRPETAEEVCRIFTQIDRERFEQQGAGIGLAVVSYYTSINSGKLSFHAPADGVGLEVRLTFPKSAGTPQPA